MGRHFLGQPRRRVPIVALVVVAGAAAVSWWQTPTTAPAPRRVAIRVDCADASKCTFVESVALDVWSEDRGPGLPLDVVVRDDVFPRLRAAKVDWQVLVPDIDADARAEADRLRRTTAQRPADWFGEYHDYTDITARLRELAAVDPRQVALQSIGASIDGRPLWALRIGAAGTGKTHMLINGTQHAREWLPTMATTCVADRLVRHYDDDKAIRDFVDTTELWVVPVVNPDGYQYTWAGDRYWRKNRRDR